MSNEIRRLSITHSPLSSAVWTGLEPATPCVTGRYSNQLNYHTIVGMYLSRLEAEAFGDYVVLKGLSCSEGLFPFCVAKVRAFLILCKRRREI